MYVSNLLDNEFLTELIKQQHKLIYTKLTLLNFDETIKENQILAGKATSGNININGNSASRYSCNISMSVAPEDVDNDNTRFIDGYWSLHTKFKVEIGIENYINSNYDKIIWFPMGTYVITNFSSSYSTNALNISIQGKDKMGLLDGSISGKLTAAHDFGTIDIKLGTEPDSPITNEKVRIEEIIREAVHTYGGEPYGNIYIYDLPDFGKSLQTYRGKSPVYLLKNIADNKFSSLITDNNMAVYINRDGIIDQNSIPISSSEITYNNRKKNNDTPTKVTLTNSGETLYVVEKYEYGDTIGYKKTDLVYAGQLTANVGEALTSVLDKIKNQLGEFEYFYNFYGQFIFQKKKNYLQNNYEILSAEYEGGELHYNLDPFYAFEFKDNSLFTQVSRNPTISNIKNDFIIWGKTTSTNNNKIPCHARIAFDSKPTYYTTLEIKKEDIDELITYYPEDYPLSAKEYLQTASCFYTKGNKPNTTARISYEVDWREIIYQMAQDYYKFHRLSDFNEKVQAQNPNMLMGITGYEQYYEDIEGFWRQLYNYKFQNKYDDNYRITYDKDGWNPLVYTSPENLKFWFDFIDSDGSISQYSVKQIGDRINAVSDNNVSAIFYRDTPTVIFIDRNEKDTKIPTEDEGFSVMCVPSNFMELFTISSQGFSAVEKIYSQINQSAIMNETVTITTVPIYFLNPNTRIFINSEDNSVVGDYIVNSISIPLQVGGTSSIQATKVNPDLLLTSSGAVSDQ